MRDEQNRLHPLRAEFLTQHIQQLCVEHSIDLRIIPGCKVYAYPTMYRIHIVPIAFIEDYCIALHEIGHVVLCHRPEQSRNYKEILAWRWAKANALFWTGEMEEHQQWCLGCWGITNTEPAAHLQPQVLL